MPSLLASLDIAGCVITIDAMGCQTDIAEQIIEQEGNYVLSLKGNQGSLLDDVKTFFEREEIPHTLKQEKTSQGGVRARRATCGWDNSYLLKVLSGLSTI